MELDLHESAFVICVDGVSKDVFDALPAKYEDNLQGQFNFYYNHVTDVPRLLGGGFHSDFQ